MSTADATSVAVLSPTCFIIGPIGDQLAELDAPERRIWEQAIEIVEKVIEPACAQHGISDPIRSDRISQPGEIPEQIFEWLRTADIVIADLTDANPNVMYELGLRHTIDKCTLSIGERNRLPFDVSVIRTVVFRRTAHGLVEARDELASMIKSCLDGNHRPVTATRLWAISSTAVTPTLAEPSSSEGEAEEEEDEEEGFLEKLAALEAALPGLTQAMAELGEFGARSGATIQSYEPELERAQEASARLALAIRLSRDLQAQAIELEPIVTRYEAEISAADPGMRHIIEQVRANPAHIAELGEFPDTLTSTTQSVMQMAESFQSAAASVEGLGPVARPLRQPTRAISNLFRRTAAASSLFQLWDRELRNAIVSHGDSVLGS
jgi:hypothetical protein